MVTSQQLSDLLTELTYTHDYVLVDAPPLMAVGDAATLASKVDGVIIVVRLDQTTRDVLDRIAEFAASHPGPQPGPGGHRGAASLRSEGLPLPDLLPVAPVEGAVPDPLWPVSSW